MKLYKTTIKPVSAFSTPLRGDTFFGHLCWGIRYLFGEDRLKSLLDSYDDAPFLVVSDAFVSGYLPKPTLPPTMLGFLELDASERKNFKKRVWIDLDSFSSGAWKNLKSDKDIGAESKTVTQMHNSINRATGTTGDGFDPYASNEIHIYGELDIYLLLDESQITVDEAKKALEFISNSGYGKDATIGKGRFEVVLFEESSLPMGGDVVVALSPLCLDGLGSKVYYEPHTRFGKAGLDRATPNPFKKPILLADTGAVVVGSSGKYAGKSIRNISNAHKDIVHQGYAITLTLKGIKNGD